MAVEQGDWHARELPGKLASGFGKFAEVEFQLAQPQTDGVALREHLLSHRRMTGDGHPLLNEAPPLPDGCGPLWRDFMELHNARQWGMGGPSPISFVEIDAWQRVRGVRLASWEIAAVKAGDAAYMRVNAARKATK